MEVRRYLSIARRRALLILAIIAAAIAAGYLITPKTETYTATSTLYVGSRAIDVDPRSGQISADRAAGLDRLITTFTQMIKSTTVARGAIEDTGVARTPTQVAGATTALQAPFSNLITISVTDADPATARALANGVAATFMDQVAEYEPRDQQTEEQVLSFFQRAALPTAGNPTDLIRNLALATLFGIVVALGLVALLEHLDISIRSNDDVDRHLELPVLGVIPALGERLPTPPPARVEGLEQVQQTDAGRGSPVG